MSPTGKQVNLKLDGDFEQRGFRVTLEISSEDDQPVVGMMGELPPSPKLVSQLRQWQQAYRRLGMTHRIKPQEIAYEGSLDRFDECRRTAQELRWHLNRWLEASSFRILDRRLRETLSLNEPVRVLIHTQDHNLRHLPWHLWELIERYSKAEVALSGLEFERVEVAATIPAGEKVRILAVLGNSSGIDVNADLESLKALSNAEVKLLDEPSRQELSDYFWKQSWDILFFAGHSRTQGDCGQIDINPHDSLTIEELKYGLKRSIAKGLKLAIFNSCDGLSLAQQLADLQIPQVIVMREPVPDQVAQEFLKYFLEAYARGEPLYLAVREARERLQGLEDHFPCATWLPVICQNPCETPPLWHAILNQKQHGLAKSYPASWIKAHWRLGAGCMAIALALILGFRYTEQLPKFVPKSVVSPSLPSVLAPKAPVWAIAFRADRPTFASGSEDGTINLWKLGSEEPFQTLTGHSSVVRSLAISFDGSVLASGHGDNTIRLWNLQTSEVTKTLTGHLGPVWSVAMSPDGRTLASGSYDRTVKLWNLQTGELKQTLAGHLGPVWSVAMSPDGRTLASGSSDQTIRVWDLQTGELKQTLTGHSDAVRAVDIGFDNQTLISGSWDKTIKVWNLHTGELSRTLLGHKDRVTTLAFNSDRQILVSGSVDQTIKLWRTDTGENLSTVSPHSDWVLAIALSPDGQTFVSSSRDKTLVVNELPLSR